MCTYIFIYIYIYLCIHTHQFPKAMRQAPWQRRWPNAARAAPFPAGPAAAMANGIVVLVPPRPHRGGGGPLRTDGPRGRPQARS